MDAAVAELYEKESLQMQYERGLKLMDLLCITENGKVLDLGCGTGLLTKALGERVGPAGKVVGVDPDKARIQLAREKYGSSNVVFLEGSTDDFPEDQYDFVYCNFVFHWVQDKEAAFRNMYKNLKPGGQLALQLTLRMPLIFENLLNLCGEEVTRKYEEITFMLPLMAYAETAKNVGFTVDVQREEDVVTTFPDIEILMDWWHGTTHGLFKPELIDADALKSLEETHKSEITTHGIGGLMILKKIRRPRKVK